jgi:hypothetical protein
LLPSPAWQNVADIAAATACAAATAGHQVRCSDGVDIPYNMPVIPAHSESPTMHPENTGEAI